MGFYKTILTIANLPFRLFFPFKTYGRQHMPQGRAVVAGNHTSLADSVMAILAMPWTGDLAIIGKAELFENKLMGWFLRKMGAFPVQRGKNDVSAVKKSLTTLKEERKLLIFPEGTRVRDETIQAKTGAALFAMRTNSPVVPVYISSGKKLFHMSKVVFGQPYYIEGDYRVPQELRRAADQMMEKIASLGE